MIELLVEFQNPKVNIDYVEFFKDAVDYRGDFNGFEIHEDFSEYNDFKKHIKMLEIKVLDAICQIKGYDELLNVKDLFLSIKSKYKIKGSYIEHSNIDYEQSGINECFKTTDTKWVAFHPNELTPFLRYQYDSIICLINHIDLCLPKLKSNTNQDENEEEIHVNFKEGEIENIYSFFKGYFSNDDYKNLLKLLRNKSINNRLHFKGQSNQLIDAFRRLHFNKVLVNVSKVMINKWLVKNFTYLSDKGVSQFAPGHTANVLSKTDMMYKCMEPIPDFEVSYPYKKDTFKFKYR